MKGWVYVISNKGMPELVKVGYTTKDPELRAGELNHTGSPHPYVVEYDVLVEDPYRVEQQTHVLLSAKREAKEWFRCSAEEAVAAIKQIAASRAISENYRRVEREKAEAAIQRQQEKLDIERRLGEEEVAVRQRFQQLFASQFPPLQFFPYWAVGSLLAFIAIALVSSRSPEIGTFILAAIGGAVLGTIFQSHSEKKRKQSAEFLALESQQKVELDAVRAKVISCPRCGIALRFERAKLLLRNSAGAWNCPKCKATISPPEA